MASTKAFLIRGDTIISEIDYDEARTTQTYLPALGGDQAFSLFNKTHLLRMMSKLNMTAAEAIDFFEMVDEREPS